MKSLRILSILALTGVAFAQVKLANPDFEAPGLDGWTVFSSTAGNKIAVSTNQAFNGKQSVRLQAQEAAASFQGLFQVLTVSPGKRYVFQIQARNDAETPLTAPGRGQISIEWKNADGTEIDRVWGPDWGADLPAKQWKKFEATGVAPIGAAKAHFVIVQHDGPVTGATGAFFVDAAVFGEAP